MQDFSLLPDLINTAGVGILIFIIWLQTNKTTNQRFEQILHQQAEREERNYQLLSQMIEESRKHSETIARLEEKLSYNWFCPLVEEHLKNKKL